MPRSFVEEEFDQQVPPRDREIILGPAMLLAIGCALVLLCGICFGVGYIQGRSSAQGSVKILQSASGQTLTSQGPSSLQKPAARGTVPGPQQATVPMTGTPTGNGTSSGNALTSYAPPGSGQGGVRPALPTGQVQSVLPQGAGVMVQIAAVSHVDDATVLMNALKRRGYAVIARREPADSLIHVQIGPFASRADANAMSQRLLSDGYNAVVMP